MGCGSSSLKGDGPTGVGAAENDPAPRPVKKTATNFSTPDYDTTTTARRQTEYAPHETERQPCATAVAVAHATNGVEQDNDSGPKQPGQELKPYHTIDDDDPMSPSHGLPPATNGVRGDDSMDPTSNVAKNQFATANDPANAISQANGDSAEIAPGESQNKGSWLGKKYKKYSDARDGRNSELSEEELKKYTGKSKDEMGNFVAEGEGVGGRQSSNMRDTPGPGTMVSGVVGYSAG